MPGCSPLRQPKHHISNIKYRTKRKALSYCHTVGPLMLLLLILHAPGCHQGPGMVDAALEPATHLNTPEAIGFWPADVTILPLTVLFAPSDEGTAPYIHLFVGLRDAHGCFVKSPGTFRMELYERVPRSDQTSGRRLSVWPDIDINNPEENQAYWRDYLRCYEFRLDLASPLARHPSAILEITFLSANKERLATQYTLELSG